MANIFLTTTAPNHVAQRERDREEQYNSKDMKLLLEQ